MAGFGLLLSLVFVPTIRKRVDRDLSTNCETSQDKPPIPTSPSLALSLAKFNPIRVLKQLLHPEILLAVSS